MSERSWGEADSAPPPKKKGIPTWLWFCGGGCLLAVVLAIVVVTWAASKLAGSTDPEKQWPKVAEILPYDERPPELDLKWGSDIGMGMYVFDDSRGYAAILMHLPGGGSADRDKLMNPDAETGFMNFGKRKDAKASKLKIQGRELDVLKFHQMSDAGGESSGGAPKVGAGPSALVDLTPEGEAGFLILQLVSLHSKEEVSDEAIETFLKPFHVGPVR